VIDYLTARLLKVNVDGAPVQWWGSVSGKTLVVECVGAQEAQDVLGSLIGHGDCRQDRVARRQIELLKEPPTLAVFRTPWGEYTDAWHELNIRDGELVDMGEFWTLVDSDVASVTLTLEDYSCYDAIFVSGREFICGGRLTTREGLVPQAITFEQMKFLAVKYCGVTVKEAAGVMAEVMPLLDPSWLMSGGFCLDPQNRDSATDHIIMVDYFHKARFGHRYSLERFLPFFKR